MSMDTAGGMSGPVIPLGFCYGEENGCDIIFLAGRDDDIWRLPAHKFLLTQSTPVFNAMLSPRFLPNEAPVPYTVHIPDVDGKALDNLLRFLYNEPVTLQSVETALMTLQASDKYICPGLARLCISFLSDKLTESNTLQILKFIRLYCGEPQNLENLAKEREILEVSVTRRAENGSKAELIKSEENNYLGTHTKLVDIAMAAESIETLCAQLLNKCLLEVDSHAEAILNSEELEELDIFTLRLIMERNTLNVKNEMLVFHSLMRWADKECKRKQLPLTPTSKRQVLGDESVFLPRYLIMNLLDFKGTNGPAQSGIFTNEELAVLLKIVEDVQPMKGITNGPLQFDKVLELLGSNPMAIPKSLQPYILTLGCPRKPFLKSHKSELRRPQKKKRPALLERWLCLKGCCRLMRPSDPSSPASSGHSSPIRTCSNRSNNSHRHHQSRNPSPLHCAAATSGPSTFDNAIERLIICWAFFFD